MKFENTEVSGFRGALRGMRNPLNSWEKSDSYCGLVNTEKTTKDYKIAKLWHEFDNSIPESEYNKWLLDNGVLRVDDEYVTTCADVAFIGPNDMKLAKRLIAGGTEHRKFLRQIQVGVDITAPLFWWKEFDTYKVGTTANSTSTMHKITSESITLDDFEIDDLKELAEKHDFSIGDATMTLNMKDIPDILVQFCEYLRVDYNETKNKEIWKELIRWLPEAWLQKRTVTMNYENIRLMVHQRENHKLNEWSGKDDEVLSNFISWADSLPYAEDLIFN